MAMRQVFARDVRRATFIDSRGSSSSVRSMASWTSSRDMSSLTERSDPSSSTSSSGGEKRRGGPPEVDASGKIKLFRSARFKQPSKLEPASNLSKFYPEVLLPPILPEPIVKPVRPRTPGQPKTKTVRPSGRIEGSRVDEFEFASRLPLHQTSLYAIAARTGLVGGAAGEQVDTPLPRTTYEGEASAAEGGLEHDSPRQGIEEITAAILQALTHPSFFESSAASDANASPIVDSLRATSPHSPPLSHSEPSLSASATGTGQRDNALLAASGRTILDFVLTEWFMKRFPNLPTNGLKLVVTALSNAGALSDVGREIGVGTIQPSRDHGNADTIASGVPVRYRRHAVDKPASAADPSLQLEAVSSAVRAIVGLIYERQGMSAAAAFIHGHFLSRSVDLQAMLRHEKPLEVLRATVVRFGLERPVPRIIAESGRVSSTPYFRIACYSGALKLGEGEGTSLAMGQHRAATNSLLGLYLTETPKPVLSISAFAPHPLHDVPNWKVERRYQQLAPEIGEVEALQNSSHRTQYAAAIAGYAFEPLQDPKTLRIEAHKKTLRMPKTVDGDRPTSTERHQAFERSDNLAGANAREHPAHRSIRDERRPVGAGAKGEFGLRAVQQGHRAGQGGAARV